MLSKLDITDRKAYIEAADEVEKGLRGSAPASVSTRRVCEIPSGG